MVCFCVLYTQITISKRNLYESRSSQELSEDIVEIAPKFTELSDALQSYFLEKLYGDGLETIVIGIICVHPKFDFFFKNRKKIQEKRGIHNS